MCQPSLHWQHETPSESVSCRTPPDTLRECLAAECPGAKPVECPVCAKFNKVSGLRHAKVSECLQTVRDLSVFRFRRRTEWCSSSITSPQALGGIAVHAFPLSSSCSGSLSPVCSSPRVRLSIAILNRYHTLSATSPSLLIRATTATNP